MPWRSTTYRAPPYTSHAFRYRHSTSWALFHARVRRLHGCSFYRRATYTGRSGQNRMPSCTPQYGTSRARTTPFVPLGQRFAVGFQERRGNSRRYGAARQRAPRWSVQPDVRLVGHAMGIRHKALCLNNACAPEIDLRSVFLGLRNARINVALAFLDIRAYPHAALFRRRASSLPTRHSPSQTHRNIVGLRAAEYIQASRHRKYLPSICPANTAEFPEWSPCLQAKCDKGALLDVC